MNLISEALAQTLQPVAPPFDWTGIIAAAIVVALVVYIIWIKRTPGVQIGEGLVDKLVAALHSNTAATQVATVAAPTITPADVQAAVNAAVARMTVSGGITIPAAALTPPAPTTGVAMTLPVQINPSVPVPIDWPNADGTPGKQWLYQGRNFATQQEIVDFDLASAARDANLANIDHSPLPLTPEQVAAAITAGGDPVNRSSWLRPSATYQSAVRIRDGLTPDDVNRRINEANGAGNYGIFPKG